MNIPSEHKGRYFYHFTHIDNIDSIVNNGLLATNVKNQMGIGHHNVANMNIQHRRSEMQVPVGPGGFVHDYVPFYFASTNKMLLGLVNRKIVDQPYVVFMIVSIEKILNAHVVFTDASANTDIPPNFYSDPDDLNKLSWSLIDSTKWKDDSDEALHKRMAEVLVYREVPLDWIEGYVVFNNISRQKIRKAYESVGLNPPPIYPYWFNSRSFFFTKFFFPDRTDETLVTGPIQLYQIYSYVVEEIIKNRKNPISTNVFIDISDAIRKIDEDFCIIPELDGIHGLPTDNPVHLETVSGHTHKVVNNLQNTQYYGCLNEQERNIVKLSAYFHDIGKGPQDKWKDGVQKTYIDHPVDSLWMLKRIFSEDFLYVSEHEIRQVCLLVAYHDLLGDIIGKGRSKSELINLNLQRSELCMLATLAEADICALGEIWSFGIREKIEELVNEVMMY